MSTYKIILTVALTLFLVGCASPKTGMEYIKLPNGHTKVIDHDLRRTSFIDHNGRVYKRVVWKNVD